MPLTLGLSNLVGQPSVPCGSPALAQAVGSHNSWRRQQWSKGLWIGNSADWADKKV